MNFFRKKLLGFFGAALIALPISVAGFDQVAKAETAPTLVGDEVVGSTLTVDLQDWAGQTVNYSWSRSSEFRPISSSSSYQIVELDIRNLVSVKIYRNQGLEADGDLVTLTTSSIVSPATVSSSAPTITGTHEVGETLSVDEGAWTTDTSFAYQWLRDGFPISGASASTYVLTTSDAFTQISVRVTGTKDGFLPRTRDSIRYSQVTSDDVVAGVTTMTVAETPAVGCQASPNNQDWESGTNFAYEWLLDGAVIKGEFNRLYTITSDDVGKKLSLRVTGSKAGKNDTTYTTIETQEIVSNGVCTYTPNYRLRYISVELSRDYAVNDTAQSPLVTVGQSIKASVGDDTFPADAVFSYRWETTPEYNSWDDITRDKDTSSYVVTDDDISGGDGRIRVTVTARYFSHTSSESLLVDVRPELEGEIPSLSGTVAFGETLTANPGTWESTSALDYQWKRNGRNISGETSETYTLSNEDRLSRLSVVVTGKSGTGNLKPELSIESDRSGVLPKGVLSTDTPSITGDLAVGETLSVSKGVWTLATQFSYQWLRNGQAISGADADRYKLTADDEGEKISVSVTGSKDEFADATETSSQTANVEEGTHQNGVAPSITATGGVSVGQTLTAEDGIWSGDPSFSYQWLRGSTSIAGETSQTYVIQAADVGSTIAVRVTASEAGYGDTVITSASTSLVPGQTLSTDTPSITGTATAGSSLTVAAGAGWTAGTNFSYKWLRGGQAISGATSASYTLQQADIGSLLTIQVTGSQLGYDPETVSASTPTPPGQISNFQGTAGDTEVALSWSAPDSQSGQSTIAGYKIEISTDDVSWQTLVANTQSTSTSYKAESLTNETSYFFRVTAINQVGEGLLTKLNSAISPAVQQTPSPPSQSQSGGGSITIEPEESTISPSIDLDQELVVDDGEERLTITGENLETLDSVTVGDVLVEIISLTDSEVVHALPKLGPGEYKISYEFKDGSKLELEQPLKIESLDTSSEPTTSKPSKTNAGSFKGYVAVYALNHEGKRLSMKIGKDWRVIPSIPARSNNLYRFVEQVGPGVDITALIYIDRVLVSSIPMTTR